MVKNTKKRKLKQSDGAKQHHKKQKLDRKSPEGSKNDESLNSSSSSKKHLSRSKELVSYQTKESGKNLGKAKASVLRATDLLNSTPSKSALAPKHRKSFPMDLSQAKITQKKSLPEPDGDKQKKGKKKAKKVLSSDEETENEMNLNAVAEKPKNLVVKALDLSIDIDRMLSPFKRIRNSDESTFYCWVDDELLEAARISNDDNELMNSVIGFGMLFSMSPDKRIEKYLKEKPFLKSDKYQMMSVITQRKTDPEVFGLDFRCTAFALELAAHCLKSHCNQDRFFTSPYAHTSANFVNCKYVDFLKQNPSFVDFTADLILKALREHDYVKEFICGECGIMIATNGTHVSRHIKNCPVVRVRNLLNQKLDEKNQDNTSHGKAAKFWCYRCGSGFTTNKIKNRHIDRKYGCSCIFHHVYELLIIREINALENDNITFDQVLNIADDLGGASVTMTREELVIDILSTRIEREIQRGANGKASSKEIVVYTVDEKRPSEVIKEIASGKIEIFEE